jgi:pathogen-inducible salicylic acid glucosyltransferase
MANSHTSSIHVLLLSYPAQGHINPLLQLGKRLAAHRGVRCTLAVTRYVLGQSKPQTGAVHVAAYSDGCDTGGYDEAGDAEAYLSRLESAGSASLDELLRAESAGGRPVRAVVYDSFLMWVPRMARRHGAACAVFFTQACVVNVAYAHAWAGQMDLPVAPGKALPELPGLPAGLGPADFPTFLTEPDGGCLAYLDLVLQQCQGFEVADHVLVNSFYELEIKVTMRVHASDPSLHLCHCSICSWDA